MLLQIIGAVVRIDARRLRLVQCRQALQIRRQCTAKARVQCARADDDDEGKAGNCPTANTVHPFVAVFGAQRQAVVARELTKRFETIHSDTLANLTKWVIEDPNRQKGEIVLLVEGLKETQSHQVTPEAERILLVLLEELPIKKAAKLAARITGVNKRALYERALRGKES